MARIYFLPCLIIALVAVFYFIFNFIKKINSLNEKREKVLQKKRELVNFLTENKNQFYSSEIIIKMEKFREIIKEIDLFFGEKQEIKFQEINEKIKLEIGDVFFTEEALLDKSLRLKILKVKILEEFLALLIGGVKPEVKIRKDFLKKCHDYLNSEVAFLNLLKTLNNRKNCGIFSVEISSSLFNVKLFLLSLKNKDFFSFYRIEFSDFKY